MKDRILLVNDDPKLASLLESNYECIPFQDSTEGLSYLENNTDPIDLIIMDMEEIIASEFKLLNGLQKHYLYNSTPVLIEASPAQTEGIEQALKMGVDDFILKPYHPDVTKKRIQNLLNIGKTRQVHNVMEDLIQSEINKNITSLGICPCPNCRKDLLTLTLNNVKPKYVSTEKGNAIIKAGQLASIEDRIHLLADITHYARLIGENPHHD